MNLPRIDWSTKEVVGGVSSMAGRNKKHNKSLQTLNGNQRTEGLQGIYMEYTRNNKQSLGNQVAGLFLPELELPEVSVL